MPKARTASNDELMRYFRNLYIAWVNDTDKVLDYLETRDEIDSNNIFYLGMRWRSVLIPILFSLKIDIKGQSYM